MVNGEPARQLSILAEPQQALAIMEKDRGVVPTKEPGVGRTSRRAGKGPARSMMGKPAFQLGLGGFLDRRDDRGLHCLAALSNNGEAKFGLDVLEKRRHPRGRLTARRNGRISPCCSGSCANVNLAAWARLYLLGATGSGWGGRRRHDSWMLEVAERASSAGGICSALAAGVASSASWQGQEFLRQTMVTIGISGESYWRISCCGCGGGGGWAILFSRDPARADLTARWPMPINPRAIPHIRIREVYGRQSSFGILLWWAAEIQRVGMDIPRRRRWTARCGRPIRDANVQALFALTFADRSRVSAGLRRGCRRHRASRDLARQENGAAILRPLAGWCVIVGGNGQQLPCRGWGAAVIGPIAEHSALLMRRHTARLSRS